MNNWMPNNTEELKTLLKDLLNFIPEPVMIINFEGKVIDCNGLFVNLVQMQREALLGLSYGEVLGCKYFNENNEECGNTYYCDICEIRQAFEERQSLSQMHNLSTGSIIVRDVVTNGTSLTKIFKLHLKEIENEGIKYYIVILKNLRKEDLEADSLDS